MQIGACVCVRAKRGIVTAAQVTAVTTAIAGRAWGIIPGGRAAILLAAALSVVTHGQF